MFNTFSQQDQGNEGCVITQNGAHDRMAGEKQLFEIVCILMHFCQNVNKEEQRLKERCKTKPGVQIKQWNYSVFSQVLTYNYGDNK